MKRALLAIGIVLVTTSAMAKDNAAPKRVTIFVGPSSRDGYVEIDKGIKDSIKDLKNQIRGKRGLAVVDTKDTAQIVLEVLGRGATSKADGGGAAVPVGGATLYIPLGTIGITTVMHVGSYEKPIVFDDCGAWSVCARMVAKDIEAWVEANADTLARQPQ
jgi:hypothetical protein